MDGYLEDDHLDDHNALLERFRAKHRELDEARQHVRLYAVLDQGGLTAAERQLLGDLEEQRGVSLYAGSGLGSLEAVGPVLLAMPDVRNIEPLTYSGFADGDSAGERFVRLLSLAKDHAARVTWIWAPHAPDVLVEHLQTLLHASLGTDGEDAWFFFYHPSHLKVLHERLPEATRQYMFGPVHAWWTLDARGGLVELAGEGAPVPSAWSVLPIPADVETALQRAAMPAQVHAWLKHTRMNPATEYSYNRQMAEIAPLVERAHGYGLSRLADLATFVVYGLRYRVDYDQHPHIAALLADTVSQGTPLAPAYRRVKAGVWRELAQSARQRMQARAERERYEDLRESGHIRLRARLVNASGKPVRDVYFDLYGQPHTDRQFLGAAIDDGVVSQKDVVLSPLPGQKLVLCWDDLEILRGGSILRTPHKSEVTVEGDVPPHDHSGLLEMRFEKYGQKVVMRRDEDTWHNAGRGRQ